MSFKNDHGDDRTFTEIGLRDITEASHSYILDDGTTPSIKQTMHTLFAADKACDGDPNYHLEGNTTVVTSHADEQATCGMTAGHHAGATSRFAVVHDSARRCEYHEPLEPQRCSEDETKITIRPRQHT